MGISPSKRVTQVLSTSPTFETTCETIYEETLYLSEHAFPGIPPYQLLSSSSRLHHSLSSSLPIVSRWLPSPPSSIQVHHAYQSVIATQHNNPRGDQEEEPCLDSEAFKAFAVRLFTGAVVENVGKAVMKRVPVGVVGIAGVGVVTRSGKDLVGAVVGVYALGVAASVYLSLGG